MKPARGTYPDYYHPFIEQLPDLPLTELFLVNADEVIRQFSKVEPAMENYAYAEGKWTVKQLLGHIIDTERILAYRALRFARFDPQRPLSFDENEFARHSDVRHRSIADMLEEFNLLRSSTRSLYKSFTEPMLQQSGETAAGPISVNCLGYVMCGHAHHHTAILRRYTEAFHNT